MFHDAFLEALGSTPSFGAPPPPVPLHDRIDRFHGGLDAAPPEAGAVVAALFDGLMSAIGTWLIASVALGWRTSQAPTGPVLAVTVFDIALTPDTPIPADTPIRLDVTVKGRGGAATTPMWDQRGRANTRFHHFFDQLFHLDLTRTDVASLAFSATIDGAPIPTLFGEAPLVLDESKHRLHSARLRDAAGAVIGAIRFDTRLLTAGAASGELAHSGLWTAAAATAYANVLGAAMVAPLLRRLGELAPRQP